MTRPWAAVSGSRIGSAHLRSGRASQDAHLSWVEPEIAGVAVADGHGHFRHFRSGTGAAVAVDLARRLLIEQLPRWPDRDSAAAGLNEELGPELISAWSRAVLSDAEEHRFTLAEEQALAERSAAGTLAAYGSTIIAMAATDTLLVVLQIGDGDAIAVRENGEVFRALPPDERLDGVWTTSLCQPDALASFRSAAFDLAADQIALAYACTDGFGTPRVDSQGWWQQVGEELLVHTRQHGLGWVEGKLDAWLEEPAQYGGDDTTLAILSRR